MDTYSIDIKDVVNRGMIPVVRKRDILRVRIMSSEEKKGLPRGSPDIVAISPSGTQITMSRSEVVKNYSYLSGKKISLAGWKSSNEYTIFKPDNTQAFAMMVPLNCTTLVNGKEANKSGRKNADYIIVLADDSGEPMMQTLGIIPSAMFKKMYHMPNNDVIQRNKGKGHKLFGKGPGGEEERLPQYNNVQQEPIAKISQVPLKQKFAKQPLKQKPIDFAGELNLDTSSLDFGDSDMYTENTPQSKMPKHDMNMVTASRPLRTQPLQTQAQTQQQPQAQQHNEYKYMAIGRLINQSGQLVGFVIQNKQQDTRNITLAQMMGLCEKRLVSNIMVTRQAETGKAYLRGNNIRIESLPSYNI